MNPIDWLNRHIDGFAELAAEERQAIEHFTLLWSLFEAECLSSKASSASISDLVRGWVDDNRFEEAPFVAALGYFRDRYFEQGAPTHHFEHLHLRKNDKPALVKAVLCGDNNDPADCVVAVLIVVYRFRNNLFHGAKWGYWLRGQLRNFEQANDVLMSAMQVRQPALAALMASARG